MLSGRMISTVLTGVADEITKVADVTDRATLTGNVPTDRVTPCATGRMSTLPTGAQGRTTTETESVTPPPDNKQSRQ